MIAPTNKSNSILAIIGIALAATSLVIVIMVYTSLTENSKDDLVTGSRKLAGELADNNLPEAAIEEYERILEHADLDSGQRGSINYLIGKIYFEDVGDYEQAAAYYIRARSLDENGSYVTEAGKNLITCLEKLGRRLDARRELDQQVSAEPNTVDQLGKLVAKVGSRNITVADFNAAMQALPPDMQQQISGFEGKRKFLDQLIGRELIYHAALREGLDRDDRLQKDLQALEKDYLVQFYTQSKIAPTVKPDSSELMLYYNANKDKFNSKSFDEVRDRVTKEYMNYIGQKALNDYIGTLLKAEPVQVFEENIK